MKDISVSQLGSVLYAKAVAWPSRRSETDVKAVLIISHVECFILFYCSYVLTCLAFPDCKAAQFFPSFVLGLTLDHSTCDQVLHNRKNVLPTLITCTFSYQQ